MNSRKVRVIGLAAFSLILLVVLFHSHNSRVNVLDDATDPSSRNVVNLLTTNKVTDTSNDENLDKAIKKQMSKLGDGDEESAIKAIEESKNANIDSQTPDSLTQDKSDIGSFDPIKELIEIRSMSPVVIFSKTYCPYSKKLKEILNDNYQITPAPIIVELDKHAHGKELQEHLADVSDRSTVPNVIVGRSTKSRGGCDDFVALHENGTLLELLKEWGGKGLDVKRIETPSNM
ncbi:hypothetical protein CAAN1_04S05622 [[Candida] anglica]|uniref:Glutaredoxin domain-containing protein n=1 Tax=[Candida] anglica TaxID=148631 RepID=A0ABP0E8U1_9ASCO